MVRGYYVPPHILRTAPPGPALLDRFQPGLKVLREALPPDVRVALASGGAGGDTHRDLSDAERTRLASFGSADRRVRFALGRRAARTLAAERLGCDAADVPLRIGADGAPRLDGAHLSIAHAGRGGDAVGAAALADRPVGVDVEPIRPRHPALWRRILRDDERPVLDGMGGATDAAQTLLWSMKEAVLKGQRTGLRAGARSVRLTLDRPARLDAGGAAAVSEASGAWRLAYADLGGLWLVVAWSATSQRPRRGRPRRRRSPAASRLV